MEKVLKKVSVVLVIIFIALVGITNLNAKLLDSDVPDFVTKTPPNEGGVMFFVGRGEDEEFARFDAQGKLADKKKSEIKKATENIKKRAIESGISIEDIKKYEIDMETKATANTSGFTEEEVYEKPDGTFVILYSYPIDDLKNDIKSAVKMFVRKEQAAFKEFKADEVMKILDNDLSNNLGESEE